MCFYDQILLKPTCCPQRQPALLCELWQSKLALGSVSVCAFCPPRTRASWFLVFERGRPLPLLGFYILTTWKPGGLKIAQRFPIFVSFRDHFRRVFGVFACVPPGMLGVGGGHILSHGPPLRVPAALPKLAPSYPEIGTRRKKKSVCCQISLRFAWQVPPPPPFPPKPSK